MGDANGNGKVTIADVTATIGHIIGITPQTFVKDGADTNGDGSVSVSDVTTIIDIILGKEE